jgi:hypothetical protein
MDVVSPWFKFLGQFLHQAGEVVPVRPLTIPNTAHKDQDPILKV